jgi:hypothetical protein
LNTAADVSALTWDYTQPFSVMIAMKRTGAPSNSYSNTVGHWEDGGNYTGWWIQLADKPLLQLSNSLTGPYCRYIGPNSLGTSGAHTLIFTYDGSGHPSGINMYVDGVHQTGADIGGDYLGTNTIEAAGQLIYFFGSNSGSNNGSDQIAEVVVANLEFSSGQAATADAYLNGQYAIH